MLVIFHFQGFSQEMPPRPVAVSFSQYLSFGAFSPGQSGGTVTVTSNGTRFSTGSVILVGMGYLYFPAVFLLEGNPGTIVHLLNGPDATLLGSNGGSMTLHLGEATPGDPIIINVAPPGTMQIRIGGTLEVDNQGMNPAGYYTGEFSLMFIQE
ncbi:MAG: DUF4402 domain-containing protein [Bacteroidetes bacterium]|nr:DUF4402 domain-containing protein [Bacteroidota bacterium]